MGLWPETSESLIQRVLGANNEAAWHELVRVYRPVIYRLARHGGLGHEAAEDVTQTVWLSVSQALPNWEPREDGPRFRSWLSRVTRNAVLNALARSKPDRGAGSTSIVERLQAHPDSDSLKETLEREARLEVIRYAAGLIQNEFSEKTWSIFTATSVTGRSADEIARELECSLGSVYASRCRVMARLRQKVEELSGLWSDES